MVGSGWREWEIKGQKLMFGMCFKIGVRIVLFEIWVILVTTKKIEYYSLRINDSVFIIGNHDLKKRNMKGEEALNLLRSHKFYASTTFSIIKIIPHGRVLMG